MINEIEMGRSGEFPFRLDKSHRATLTDQLVEGVRQAIAEGRLREGDRLPSREAIAERFGVSLQVPRTAYRRLRTEGLIMTRPRLGSVVMHSTGARQWKGVVLYVNYETIAAAYCGAVIETELRSQLAAAGFLMLTASLRRKTPNSFDFSAVERCLDFNVSLVIVGTRHPTVRRWVERHRLPYVVSGGERGANGCVATIVRTGDSGQSAFVDQCLARGVRRVLQVGFEFPGALDLRPRLEKVGIACEVWTIPPLRGLARFDGIVQASLKAFHDRLEREGKSWLPDLILFADDYVASGALTAFAEHGVRSPKDVRVVSLVNEGSRIPYLRTLAAFVNRPKFLAVALAQAALAYLNRTGEPQSVSVSLSYERGETFP